MSALPLLLALLPVVAVWVWLVRLPSLPERDRYDYRDGWEPPPEH